VRKIAGVSEALSKVRIGKDGVSRIASRLQEQHKEWRERALEEKEYSYLVPGCYLPEGQMGREGN
jgi:putative transposase